ncbi:D-alanine--D-alanine ligase [Clostridiaceae bacterium NSJ-31]|uniref:D-alanine--D-alanine ligase n=1 Tax=Ligaoa zhengdingensis TaxID=2763658 RepID=A0A926I4C5_9FIRM|nr:D-alanine--D-alanine ligase family protein [Ligaoa zhengdingensis]MBC8546260.1 D-alanine--D-alanine ligase [Ligaoa zhengdingensis]
MKKRSVAILFGGVSSEYEVSLVSAASVIRNTPADRYDVTMVGITRDGRWRRYTGPVELIEQDRWADSSYVQPAFVSPDRGHHGLVVPNESGCEIVRLDAVFPVLHGKNGEDGTIQGLFELAGIPYVGCGPLSSAVCMDKAVTHTILAEAGIPQARWQTVLTRDFRQENFAALEGRLRGALGYPMFVKPANAGSSVGISKAHGPDELRAALALAFQHDCKAVVEEFIDGSEVESAVLGNDQPVVSVLGEIVPCNEFYDYEAKYQNDATELHIPARIPDETAALIRETAARAYRALGCSGLTRIDFFVKRDGTGIVLNEPNTIPGFTSISMYPKLMAASGVPYSELIDRLFTLAIERMAQTSTEV